MHVAEKFCFKQSLRVFDAQAGYDCEGKRASARLLQATLHAVDVATILGRLKRCAWLSRAFRLHTKKVKYTGTYLEDHVFFDNHSHTRWLFVPFTQPGFAWEIWWRQGKDLSRRLFKKWP
jgi:hypothetical protein